MPTVRELREAKGLSQEKLAALAHVSARTINRMEAGSPTLESTVVLIAQALGVRPDAIEGVNIVNRVSHDKQQ